MSQTPLTFSHSAVKAWRRCKRQFSYKFIEGLEARRPSEPLKLGSWGHELLEAHYTDYGWEKRHRELTKAFNRMSLDEREFYGDLPTLAHTLMTAYIWNYRKEEANWEILEVETRFAVEADDDTGDIFSFKPDLIVREKDSGLIAVVDHKWTRSIPDAAFRLADTQSTVYPWGLDIEGSYDVDLFIFNYIRRKVPTIPHTNKNGQLSTRKIDSEYYTLAHYLIQFYGGKDKIPKYWRIQLRSLKDRNNFFKRSRMAKDPTVVSRQVVELGWTLEEMEAFIEFAQAHPDEDPWVRTTLNSCSWDCDFHDVCQAELLGADASFIKKTRFQPSPYVEEMIHIGTPKKRKRR